MRACILLFLFVVACKSSPKLDSENSYTRARAVNTTEDKAAVARLARTDPAHNVRLSAIKRVTDQAVLAEAAQKDKNVKVRVEAVKRLDDQAVLEKVWREDKSWEVRYAALGRLRNQAVLERSANADKNAKIRALAVSRINDQAALERLARTCPFDEVRLAATGRLTNENTLADIAVGDKSRLMQGMAASRIKSRAPLVRLLGEAKGLPQQIAHVGLLVHDPVFQRRFPGATLVFGGRKTKQGYGAYGFNASTYVHGDSIQLRVLHETKAIASKSWRTSFPSSIRSNSSKHRPAQVDVRPLVQQLTDKLTAADRRTLVDSPSGIVRRIAYAKLDDPVLATKAAQEDRDPVVRANAVTKVTDPAVLAALAVSDKDTRVRAAAIAQSKDQALKARVARTDPSDQVRYAAVKTLTDKDTLTEIANDPEESKQIRDAAKARLK